jgi:hypothetical protein
MDARWLMSLALLGAGEGLPVADGQLWKYFHNCPYRRSVVMQGRPLHSDRKSLPDRRFRLSEHWKDFP